MTAGPPSTPPPPLPERKRIRVKRPDRNPFRLALRTLGTLFVIAGLGIVVYIGYQNWWTGRETQAAQSELSGEFAERRAALASGQQYVVDETLDEAELESLDAQEDPTFNVVESSTEGPSGTFAPGSPGFGSLPQSDLLLDLIPELVIEEPPPTGTAVARMTIPKIEFDWTVVEGTSQFNLRSGPGHFSGTPLPGQPGNAVISAHRTTYGAPFFNLDALEPGDLITVETIVGSHVYEVVDSIVVGPNDSWVLTGTEGAVLTLTTCHPRFSSQQRLVVRSKLVGGPNADAIAATFGESRLPAPPGA